MKVKIVIPQGLLRYTYTECPDSRMSRAVGLRHCLDEIDNTIRPNPV